MDSVPTVKKCADCVFCKPFTRHMRPIVFCCTNLLCYVTDVTDYVRGGILLSSCGACQGLRRNSESCGTEGIYFIERPKEVKYDA